MVQNRSFETLLLLALRRGLYSEYGKENYDAERFGETRETFRARAGLRLRAWLRKCGLMVIPGSDDQLAEKFARLDGKVDALAEVCRLLVDEYSKTLLPELVAFRVLGNRRIKLPTNNPEYWRQKRLAESLIVSNENIPVGFLDWKLNRFDLHRLKIPVELFFTANGVLKTFLLRQYEYRHPPKTIRAEPGQIVIDGGGCWGDTALYFSNLVGENGRVYCYEFVPDNLKVLQKNLELNPALGKRVELVKKALSDRSGEQLFFQAQGPASTVSKENPSANLDTVETLAIDDLVIQQGIPRVDFIKMDIEGAELKALQGARNTIQKWRPTLAIALYHDLSDFVTIPKFLESLGVGYRYHLDHFTIHKEETILFASPT